MTDAASSTSEQVGALMQHAFALVKSCPVGRVTTYSWVGKALGYPRGARMIGWIMNEATGDIPAQRVISSKGELTGGWAFGGKDKMRQLLETEGVAFLADDHVDLKRYGWDPSRDLSQAERDNILNDAANISVVVSPRLLQLLTNDPASPLRSL